MFMAHSWHRQITVPLCKHWSLQLSLRERPACGEVLIGSREKEHGSATPSVGDLVQQAMERRGPVQGATLHGARRTREHLLEDFVWVENKPKGIGNTLADRRSKRAWSRMSSF
jgi:hypothetical protein